MDIVTQLLNRGIMEKRMGNYGKALEYYEQAKSYNPVDERIYSNIFKIHIGLEYYEKAIQHMLVAEHFNIIEDYISKDFMAKNMVRMKIGDFEWNDTILSKSFFRTMKFNPNYFKTALQKNPKLDDLIYRAENMTFYAGHCILQLRREIGKYYKIPKEPIDNLNKKLLGKNAGDDLRNSKFYPLLLNLGFQVLAMNLDFSLTDKNTIAHEYIIKKPKLNIENT